MKAISKQVRGYLRSADRERAISLLKRSGYNYFVCFKDVQSKYALQYSVSEWVKNSLYLDWYILR